jgi:hypothetical protein
VQVGAGLRRGRGEMTAFGLPYIDAVGFR